VTRWVWKRSHGRTSEAPPDERGGNSYARPTATAPHSDSTNCVGLGSWCAHPINGNNRTFSICSRVYSSCGRLFAEQLIEAAPFLRLDSVCQTVV